MTFAKNKKARHEYEYIDSYEAGISLMGPEVKSIREGRVNLKGSYISIDNGNAILKQCHINRPEHLDGFTKFEETRPRQLLLHKKEIQKLQKYIEVDGLTLIADSVYSKAGNSYFKVSLKVAKGLKHYDKRAKMKSKSQDMEAKRAMKDY